MVGDVAGRRTRQDKANKPQAVGQQSRPRLDKSVGSVGEAKGGWHLARGRRSWFIEEGVVDLGSTALPLEGPPQPAQHVVCILRLHPPQSMLDHDATHLPCLPQYPSTYRRCTALYLLHGAYYMVPTTQYLPCTYTIVLCTWHRTPARVGHVGLQPAPTRCPAANVSPLPAAPHDGLPAYLRCTVCLSMYIVHGTASVHGGMHDSILHHGSTIVPIGRPDDSFPDPRLLRPCAGKKKIKGKITPPACT